MTELVVRPTMKFIRAGYAAALVVFFAAFVAYLAKWKDYPWLPLVAAVLLLWPAMRHMRRQLTKAVISGDRLRYETGLTSKSTRTIQLSKVQDVRVDQSLGQRLWGVGDLSIETAGETSRLTIRNIDGPQQMADRITDAAQQKGATNAG